MVRLKKIIPALLCCLMTSVAVAKEAGKPFSATAVQLTPEGAVQTRVAMTHDAIRNEYEQDGNVYVEIIHPKQNKRVLLFPEQKIFIEQYAPAFPDRRIANENSPCENLPGTLCRKLGNEEINGIETEKWEFSHVERGRPIHTLHWIDRERELPIREFFPNGSIVEMVLLGDETVNERDAEKWRMQVMSAKGQRTQFLQWYDPELKLVIREEHPDGYVRELRDIKVGKHAADLFSIPKGYKRSTQPPPPDLTAVQPTQSEQKTQEPTNK